MSYLRIFTASLAAALVACVALPGAASGHDDDRSEGWGKFKVGAAVIHIELTGIAGERRPMDVLLLYPADRKAFKRASPLLYGSRLTGVPIVDPNNPERWVPMSFTMAAEGARHGVPIDQRGRAFPLLVYSHPNGSDPQNQTPTLERLASHGFVVAAPWHEGDTREDQMIDTINARAGAKILPCFDGGSSPCSDATTPTRFQAVLQNRARDIAVLLDQLPGYFGDRVDLERVGLFGQSRGSLTTLAAAAGSTTLNIPAEPRIKAIMLLAIGTRSFVLPMNLADITVPSLFITSKGDRNAGPQVQMNVSLEAFNTIPDSTTKGVVILERAEHATYSSNRCAQMQATGAVLQAAGANPQGEPRAVGEQLLFENIMVAGNAGTPIEYCGFDPFVNPVDIRPLVKAVTGTDVTEDTVPTQLDSATAMRVVVELANTFYRASLVKRDDDDDDARVPFKRYLSPKFLMKEEGAVVSYAETQTPRGRAVACDDPDLVSLDPSCAVQDKDDHDDD